MDYSDLASFQAFAERRNIQLKKLLGEPPAQIQQSETHYTTQDGTQMRVKVYRPTTPPSNGSPLVVMFHGGGFCIGAPEGEEQTCRNLVLAFGAVCVSCSYRLAPAHKFPYAARDSWDALRWAARSAQELGADPSQGFVVGGTSAGGNLAAVVAHLARDEGLSPPLTGQYLAIPALAGDGQIPSKYKDRFFSMEQNKSAPVLPRAAMDMFTRGYQPDKGNTTLCKPVLHGTYTNLYSHPLDTVMNHPKGHHDLPPTFLQIDGLDPLRDEALIYETMLREEYGVKTRFEVYPGLPHGHWGFFPFLKGSAKFRADQVHGFGWLLNRTPDVTSITTQMNATTV